MPDLQDFAGRWRLTRRIEDRRAGQQGRFEGEACFTAEGDALAYTERGLLTLGVAPPMTAERRYLWTRAGRLIAVAFDDGRPFHSFDPTAGAAEATHGCDPDTYEVAYDFTAWPAWRSAWTVSGPRKDYRLESTYLR